MKAREQREQEIAFSDKPLITRMMEVLEHRGYVDTDWRSENTFEEDVRPLFEKMIEKATKPKFPYVMLQGDGQPIARADTFDGLEQLKNDMINSGRMIISKVKMFVITTNTIK